MSSATDVDLVKKGVIRDAAGLKKQAVMPMIVSASRATDIPAFFGKRLIDRIKAGYAVRLNPFNRKPVYVSFQNARLFVFWTKNPRPFIESLSFFDEKNFHYYFQFTLNDYGDEGLEPGLPPRNIRVKTFKDLSDKIGKEKVIWRFDPFFKFSHNHSVRNSKNAPEIILEKLKKTGDQICVYTDKLVFSFIDIFQYKKVQKKLLSLSSDVLPLKKSPDLIKETLSRFVWSEDEKFHLVDGLSVLLKEWRRRNPAFEMASCCEGTDLSAYGIKHNRCIDDELIARLFSDDQILMRGLKMNHFSDGQLSLFDNQPAGDPSGNLSLYGSQNHLKDKGQREHCGCIQSKDIGNYNTCPHDCLYCYANTSKEAVKQRLEGQYHRHEMI